jgi:protocatechuate 3,4-dioxygenase beta subunit
VKLALVVIGGLCLTPLLLMQLLRPTSATSAPPPAPANAHGSGDARARESVRRSRPPEPQLRDPRPSRGSIAGRVETRSGAPIGGAMVCFAAELGRAELPPSACRETDSRGQFQLETQLDHADLVVSAPGYSTRRLPETEVRAGVVIRLLQAEAIVSGLVLDATGGVLDGALVLGRRVVGGAVVGLGWSDSEGRFELGVPLGRLQVSASAHAYSLASAWATAPATNVILSLAPAGSIIGRVISADAAEPLAYVTVTARGGNGLGTLPPSSRTEADGSFRFDALATGNYELVATSERWRSDPQRIALDTGGLAGPVVLTARPAASLSAVVSISGQACLEGYVELSGPQRASEPIGDAGAVDFRGLVPGHYRAQVSCSQALELQEDLELQLGEQLVRHWDLAAGLAVRGRVEDEGGDPVAGAAVRVAAVGRALAKGGLASSSARCTSDDTGSFRCAGLRAGEYECYVRGPVSSEPVRVTLDERSEPSVVLRTPASGTLRAVVDAAPDAPSLSVLARGADGVVIPAERRGAEFVFERLRLGRYTVYVASSEGEPAGRAVEAELARSQQTVSVILDAPRQLSISGRAVDDQGDPVGDAWVRFCSSNPTSAIPSGAAVLTDEQGRFEIGGLVSGRYDLRIRASFGEGRLEHVAAGATGQTLRVDTYGALSGSVETAAGDRVAAFSLEYGRGDGQTESIEAGAGVWTLPWLPPGTYQLRARSPDGEARSEVVLAPGGDAFVSLVLSAPAPMAPAAPEAALDARIGPAPGQALP